MSRGSGLRTPSSGSDVFLARLKRTPIGAFRPVAAHLHQERDRAQTLWLSWLSKTGVPIRPARKHRLQAVWQSRDPPSIIILLLSLEGVRAHGQLPQRSMWECPVNVG